MFVTMGDINPIYPMKLQLMLKIKDYRIEIN